MPRLDEWLDDAVDRLERWYARLPWPLALVVAVVFVVLYVLNTRS